jgi:hypothetical protein
MNANERVTVAAIYQSDLDRHLFAPSLRPIRTRRRNHDPLADRVRDWFMAGWARWKELAEAASFS